jgi:23S rRNA pseudouridine955/2504/2580 synthase
MWLHEAAKQIPPSRKTAALLAERILYEDENFIILNKPSGMSVHVGSTVRVGVIEAMQHMYSWVPHLELGHRLDSETSGCLVLSKRKRILREWHALLRAGKVTKIYWALTHGQWQASELRVDLPLRKEYHDGGRHAVTVHADGKESLTIFRPLQVFSQATLVEAKLYTGRTHQIRVHAQYRGHPIAGDDRYGNLAFNKLTRQWGIKRLFLHARAIDFTLFSLHQRIRVEAPLDLELEAAMQALSAGRGEHLG